MVAINIQERTEALEDFKLVIAAIEDSAVKIESCMTALPRGDRRVIQVQLDALRRQLLTSKTESQQIEASLNEPEIVEEPAPAPQPAGPIAAADTAPVAQEDKLDQHMMQLTGQIPALLAKMNEIDSRITAVDNSQKELTELLKTAEPDLTRALQVQKELTELLNALDKELKLNSDGLLSQINRMIQKDEEQLTKLSKDLGELLGSAQAANDAATIKQIESLRTIITKYLQLLQFERTGVLSRRSELVRLGDTITQAVHRRDEASRAALAAQAAQLAKKEPLRKSATQGAALRESLAKQSQATRKAVADLKAVTLAASGQKAKLIDFYNSYLAAMTKEIVTIHNRLDRGAPTKVKQKRDPIIDEFKKIHYIDPRVKITIKQIQERSKSIAELANKYLKLVSASERKLVSAEYNILEGAAITLRRDVGTNLKKL